MIDIKLVHNIPRKRTTMKLKGSRSMKSNIEIAVGHVVDMCLAGMRFAEAIEIAREWITNCE